MISNVGLSTQAATLIAGLIGGVIGSVGTYFAQNRLQKKQKIERTEWLRRALLSELESMDALSAWPLDPDRDGIPAGNWLHNQVFESVSSELGLLNTDELHAVIKFHAEAKHVRGHIRSAIDSPGGPSDDEVDTIQSYMDTIKRERQAAIHLLYENLNPDE